MFPVRFVRLNPPRRWLPLIVRQLTTRNSYEHQRRRSWFRDFGLVSVAMAIGFGGGLWTSRKAIMLQAHKDQQPQPAATPVTTSAKPDTEKNPTKPSHQFNFIADAAARVADAVVHLRVEEDHGNMFSQRVLVSLGSGFIIGAEGTILTCAHVVMGMVNEGQARMGVTLQDGRKFGGIVYSIDPISDLAIIKLTDNSDTQALPTVNFGSCDNVRLGDWVVAVGSPLGFQGTVTAGVVSSLHRGSTEVGLINNRMEFIQTDCSIHEGNSGGPLVDLNGDVIGINSVRANAHGISFAMRTDVAMTLIRQLAEEGRVVRPWIGMRMVGLTPNLIQQFDSQEKEALPDLTPGSILVTTIFRGSPADRAGIAAGDLITHMEGELVESTGQLLRAMTERVGHQIQLTIRRRVSRSKDEERLIKVCPEELDVFVNREAVDFVFQ